jgi:hypothetical protein
VKYCVELGDQLSQTKKGRLDESGRKEFDGEEGRRKIVDSRRALVVRNASIRDRGSPK